MLQDGLKGSVKLESLDGLAQSMREGKGNIIQLTHDSCGGGCDGSRHDSRRLDHFDTEIKLSLAKLDDGGCGFSSRPRIT